MPDFLSFGFDPASWFLFVMRRPIFRGVDGRRGLVQEYEDYDDYEEDGGEQDEEYEEEEEEDPKPSKEELEYLEFRQRMKERIRKQMMKKEGASASRDKRKLPYDK